MINEDMSEVTIKQAVLNLPYKTKKYIFDGVNNSFPHAVVTQGSFTKSGGASYPRSEDVAQIDFVKGVSFRSQEDGDYSVDLKIVMDQVKIIIGNVHASSYDKNYMLSTIL